MFNNLVNRHDFMELYYRLVDNNLPSYFISPNRRKRVEGAWDKQAVDVNYSKATDLQVERFNRFISGDPAIDRFEHATRKYFGNEKLKAVSLGCGSGEHEISWFNTGGFSSVEGYDLSPSRIDMANAAAREKGIDAQLKFFCRDIFDLEQSPDLYDVVIFESSLHHFSPLEDMMRLVKTILKPGGLVLMCEFVGPTKFQWLPRQIELVNELLGELPENYRILKNGRLFNQLHRPSLMRMHLMDPSEAIESSGILPMINEHFSVLEESNAGGAILNHVLPKIQHNFSGGTDEDLKWLRHCFEFEDLHISSVEEISYWYVFGVYQNNK